MANRAYLFSKDEPNAEIPFEECEPYYDSRHVIPIAWWFLFQPSDVVLVDFEGWQEVRFIANREEALKRFSERQNLLLEVVGTEFDTLCIQRFYETICERSGKCLLMNPTEIFEEEGADDANDAITILNAIDSANPSKKDLVPAIRRFSTFNFDNENDFELYTIGYTYWP